MEPEDELLVWQFMHIEGDSPLPMSADGFSIRFESYHGHISMLLEITEHTRKEDLVRGGWLLIAQWQDRLREWHARTESEGQIFDLRANRTKRKEWLLREMLKMKQAGKSWRQIAEYMNGYIERELQDTRKTSNATARTRPTSGTCLTSCGGKTSRVIGGLGCTMLATSCWLLACQLMKRKAGVLRDCRICWTEIRHIYPMVRLSLRNVSASNSGTFGGVGVGRMTLSVRFFPFRRSLEFAIF